MKEIIQLLMEHPDFKEDEHWRRIKVDRDAQVISQGEMGDSFYMVESGALRVLGKVALDDVKSMNPGVYDVKPGDIVGELILFDREPRSATVKSLEESVLIEFNGVKTMTFLQQHSDIGFQFMTSLMNIMVDRLRSSNQRVFSLLAWGLKAHGIQKEL